MFISCIKANKKDMMKYTMILQYEILSNLAVTNCRFYSLH